MSEATLTRGQGNLDCVVIRNHRARGILYLQGAHVTEYQPINSPPVLFVSNASQYRLGSPIRGGVPICFPWFADKQDEPSAPSHGLARLQRWELDPTSSTDALRLTTQIDLLELRLEALFDTKLSMALTVTNQSPNNVRFEAALHTYLRIGDIRRIHIYGLEQIGYFDKVAGNAAPASGQPIHFNSEVDRVYTGTTDTCVLHDPDLKRRIFVEKRGSQSTIIWNPWITKAKHMADFGDNEWPQMCCIETANVDSDAVRLAPGAHHTLTAHIRVDPI